MRRSFSGRAREAAFLQAHGHSRKETAEILGVAPETVSVWKRHPQWKLEIERWRELADGSLDRKQLRLQVEASDATVEALRQLQEIMEHATKRAKTSSGLKEAPDWPTRLKACRLVLAASLALIPELAQASQPTVDHRTLRIVP